MKRILFISESVTLAHLVRPWALANALDLSRYKVAFASSGSFSWAIDPNLALQHLRISSPTPAEFLSALHAGQWLYDLNRLREQLKEDLALFAEFKPEIVVGDFRLSLAVSTKLAKLPYIALSNAYWSPYASNTDWPVPSYPVTRAIGIKFSQLLFRRFKSSLLSLNARFMDHLALENGQAAFESFQHSFVDSDHTLYCDIPQVVPSANLPENHRYIGPINWSPECELPSALSERDKNRALCYLSLGSSGAQRLIAPMVRSLIDLGYSVLLVAPASALLGFSSKHLYRADLVPGAKACQLADFVICNGGSPSVYQALACAKPVLGVASNLDQLLMMHNVELADFGVLLRADQFSRARFSLAIQKLQAVQNRSYKLRQMSQLISKSDSHREFQSVLDSILGADTNIRRGKIA